MNACNFPHEGMYIAPYYWRPGQSWLVLKGAGVAFLEDSYDLGAGPLGAQVFQKLVQSSPYRQTLSNSVDSGDRLD